MIPTSTSLRFFCGVQFGLRFSHPFFYRDNAVRIERNGVYARLNQKIHKFRIIAGRLTANADFLAGLMSSFDQLADLLFNGVVAFVKKVDDLGRVAVYAQYQLRLSDQMRLELSMNIENLFDTSTAERIYSLVNLYDVSVPDARLLSGNFDFRNTGFTPDKRYGMETWFHTPISVRLGVKLLF